jgi:hypothetical protein
VPYDILQLCKPPRRYSLTMEHSELLILEWGGNSPGACSGSKRGCTTTGVYQTFRCLQPPAELLRYRRYEVCFLMLGAIKRFLGLGSVSNDGPPSIPPSGSYLASLQAQWPPFGLQAFPNPGSQGMRESRLSICIPLTVYRILPATTCVLSSRPRSPPATWGYELSSR